MTHTVHEPPEVKTPPKRNRADSYHPAMHGFEGKPRLEVHASGVLEVPRLEASGFGVMHVDADDRIVHFLEKPRDPPGIPGNESMALASMGIYVFKTTFLFELLTRDASDTASSRDFGKDIIPYIVKNGKAVAHHFERSCVRSSAESGAYWRDVGTVDAYWEANIDLTAVVPELNMYDDDWPIWTHQEQLPPAKFVFDDEGRRGMAVDSLVSGGNVISGATIRRSLLFSSVHVHSHAVVEDSVILPKVDIGEDVRLRRVVVDKQCRIPAGMQIGFDPAQDAKRFHVTAKGVTLVTPDMLGQHFHQIR